MPKTKRLIYTPFDLEQALIAKGNNYVIGLDEAGRGALAGGLAIGYCVLPFGHMSAVYISEKLEGVTDSKKITEKRRKELFNVIKDNSLASGCCIVGAGLIDAVGLSEANRIGVKLAVTNALIEIEGKITVGSSLPFPNDARIHILCDKGLFRAYDPRDFPYGMTEYVKGEYRSLSIAAASIMAKVTRDEVMSAVEPEDDVKWGFAKHKGYGTAEHVAAIYQHGIHSIHRRTFAPIPSILKANGL